MAQILDRSGVAVRAGHHCAQPLHEKFGISATTRASFYLYNLPTEVDKLVDGIYEVKKIFGKKYEVRARLRRFLARRRRAAWDNFMDDLYRDNIIDHYKNPQYRGHLDPNNIQFEDDNPLCGDHIEVTLRVDETGQVTDGRFDGKGCAISQASADLLIESVIGKKMEDVKKLSRQDVLDLLGIEAWTCPIEVRIASSESAQGRCLRPWRSYR